jgi:hypothetical protein
MQPGVFAVPEGQPTADILTLTNVRQCVRDAADALGLDQTFHITPHPLRAAVHSDERGPRVVFIVNPGASDVRAELQLPRPLRLRDALNDERFEGTALLSIAVGKQSCRMLIVENRA